MTQTRLREDVVKSPDTGVRPAGEWPRVTARSFVLVTPYSGRNLGDGAIQESVIAGIRRRRPDALIRALTLDPDDTRGRHGIDAFPIAAGLAAGRRSAGPGPSGEEEGGVAPHPGLAARADRLLAGLARRLLAGGWPWKIKTALLWAWREPPHWVRAFRFLRGVDLLLVSGGGQLDEDWGGPWGHPFALWKWCLLARLRGARVAFLSVGVCTLKTAAGRRLARGALGLASYRSYRDAGSRELIRRAGWVRDDPVVPDLAFGFPSGRLPAPPARGRAGVGLCPLAYFCPGLWCRDDEAVYRRYLDRLCDVAGWLLAQGHEVVLFCSDTWDHPVLDEFADSLRRRLGEEELRRLRVHHVRDVEEFLEIAASLECLVVSRLHSVILGQLAGTPAVALSFDRKVDVQMEAVGHWRFRLPIDGFELPEFTERFDALLADLDAARGQLRDHLDLARRAVDAQYDALLGSP